MRELRHDFRAIYHISYDETETNEAIDLILTLPQGSNYVSARYPALMWTDEQYMFANIIDYLAVINWRMAGHPSHLTPDPMERPGDRQRQKQAIQKSKSVRQKIENTRWKEA